MQHFMNPALHLALHLGRYDPAGRAYPCRKQHNAVQVKDYREPRLPQVLYLADRTESHSLR